VDSLAGRLLIASPSLLDPNFHRTVVLVTAHDENGAMGLVLNRPAEATVGDALPELAPLVDDEETSPVHVGGPVEPSAVMALAEFDEPDEAAAIIFEDVGFLAADGDNALAAAATRRVRVFAGYAGWGAGQLETELEEEAWIVHEPLPDDVFADDGSELWRDVLRRMGGPYALVAMMPPDPSMN
jgi:putative transcriptional regulator